MVFAECTIPKEVNMWTIVSIDESDYGCEERLPGEPKMLLIALENDGGERIQFEAPEIWIDTQGLNEGDEWPELIEDESLDDIRAASQSEWIERYNNAIQELKE